MTPTCSRAAIRLFVAFALVQSLVNAAALLPHPHQVLNARQVVSLPVVETPAPKENTNVFDAIINTLKGYNGWQVFQSFFDKLFNNTPAEPTPAVPSPSSPADIVSVVASIFSEVIATAEPTPTEEPIFSILPIGDLTSGIQDVTTELPTATILPPFVSINATVPTNPLILTNPLRPTEVPVVNVTGELNITISLTSTVELTVTVPPVPLVTVPLVTAAPSVGTELPLPISDLGSVLFPNVTTITPTIVLVTGTEAATIAPTLVVSPLYPNATSETAAPIMGTGTAVSSGIPIPSAIVEPIWANETLANATTVPVVVVGTGIVSAPSGSVTAVIGTETVLFPNATVEATPSVTDVVVLGTGTAVASAGTILASVVVDTASPLFPNATAVETPTVIIGTGIPLFTPPAEVGTVGTIVATPIVDTAVAIFPNATTTTTTVLITPTALLGTAVATVIVEPASEPIPNITIITPSPTAEGNTTLVLVPTSAAEPETVVEPILEPTPIVDVFPTLEPTIITDIFPTPIVEPTPPVLVTPVVDNATLVAAIPTISVAVAPIDAIPTVAVVAPVESVAPVAPVAPIAPVEPAVEFPGVLALRRICADPQIKTLSLPLLSRFHGPSGYPSLLPFPGCRRANPRQKIQAPGLLNCSALGAEVQNCQAQGRRVLLSIKGDSPDVVDENLDFGDPNSNVTWAGYSGTPGLPANISGPPFPNLFDERHPPSAFALTMFSLFGEGREERADLRPLGPDTPTEDGISWVTRPLGEEAIVDGFDVQLPAEWQGTYQDGQFQDLVDRLRELEDDAWIDSGAVSGGPNDLGADGKGVVYFGWQGERSKRMVKYRVGDFEVEVRY